MRQIRAGEDVKRAEQRVAGFKQKSAVPIRWRGESQTPQQPEVWCAAKQIQHPCDGFEQPFSFSVSPLHFIRLAFER